MVGEFDAYHRWLGIPPAEQPPNFYRLLGLQTLEDDRDVIDGAADRQTAHLRNHQAGPHRQLAQKLLNEVAAARVCLLNPQRKAAYDAKLRAAEQGAANAAPEETPEWAEFAMASTRPTSRALRRRKSPLPLLIGLTAAGIACVGIAAAFWFARRDERPEPTPDARTPSATTTTSPPTTPPEKQPPVIGPKKLPLDKNGKTRLDVPLVKGGKEKSPSPQKMPSATDDSKASSAGKGVAPSDPADDDDEESPAENTPGKSKAVKPKAGDEAAADEAAVEAVRRGLNWLVKNQRSDGSWTFQTTQHPGSYNNPMAATSMALLPLLRARKSPAYGQEHRDALVKGLAYLTSHAKTAGQFCDLRGIDDSGMYAHAVGALALCGATRGNKDPKVRRLAQGAIHYIIAAQDPKGGGWRYRPGESGDTSVLGWQMSALAAAKELRMTVPPAVWAGAAKFLDSVQSDDGRAYGYERRGIGSPATTAIGLLCRTQLGWTAKTPALREGVASIAASGPSDDTYFNFYATRLLAWWGANGGDDDWAAWRKAVREVVVRSQDRSGESAGCWRSLTAANRYNGRHFVEEWAGSLGTTSLNLLILLSAADE